MTTTSYGTWTNRVDQYATSPEHSAVEAFGSEGANGFDFDAIVRDWTTAINEALPIGLTLAGSEFYGPYPHSALDIDGYPTTEDGNLDIQAIVDGIDFWAIAERHHTDA